MGIPESISLQSHEVSTGAEPLTMATVHLDSEAAKDLQHFIESTPLVQLRGSVKDYLTEDDQVLEWLVERSPDICLIDFDDDRRRASQTAERIRERLETTSIFALSANTRSDLIIQAMRSGCSEYLVKPTDRDQFLEAVARVGARRKDRREPFNGEVLTFLGAKGGCGVTTLATHLGTFLAKACARKTVLIDLHPANGDTALYLGFTKYPYHFYELAVSTERLDAELLQSFLLHHSSGVDLLPAPEFSEPTRHIGPEAISRTIEFIRLRYDFVLIDCPPGLSTQNTEVLRRSNQVYLVTVAEVPALRNLTRYLEYLTRVEFSQERVRVVLNRYLKRGAISDDEIEKAIRHKVYWKVPNQYNQVVRTINGGDPSAAGGSEVARTILNWAEEIGRKPAEGEGRKKSNRGLLGLLGG